MPAVVRVAGSVGGRLTLGAIAVVAAFHFSLLTLVRDLGLDTPLAYLGIVPFISIGIALALPRDDRGPKIYDRQLDHIVGLPLAAAAVIAIKVLPNRLSTVYWDDRIDLVTLPVFVFAVSVLLFGVRSTWRYRVPILFLFMAWPYPYALVIEHITNTATSTTINALDWVLGFFPVAQTAPGPDPSIFNIVHNGQSFQVQIASACAGVNSMVGFVLVGTAFLAVVGRKARKDGTPRNGSPRALFRKSLWIVIGLTLVWALNIVRLVIVLWAGKHLGQSIALDGLHPFIGIVIFAGAIIVLLMAMPLLGLQAFAGQRAPVAPAAPKPEGLVNQVRAAAARPIAAGSTWRLAVVAVAVASVFVGVTDSSFAHYQLISSDFGTPKQMGFDAAPPTVNGYVGAQTGDYTWVQRYFGGSSLWHRYTYAGTSAATVGGGTIVADVIDGSSLSPFNAYGIEACYQFHGYSYSSQQPVDLGAGVRGYTLAYRDPSSGTTFNVLYWVWAVQTKAGKRYERVVLLDPSSIQALSAANPDSSPLVGVGYTAGGSKSVTASSAEIASLTAFAKTVITTQPAAPTSSTTA